MRAVSKNNKLNAFLSLVKLSLADTEVDYTTISIRKAILLLAVPMMLELGMESVFALVDIYFVNLFLDNHAVTTVGLTESVITLVYSVAIGLSMAATATVARRIGEKNRAAAAHAGSQAILITFIISLFFAVAGIVLAPQLLGAMGAGNHTINIGKTYTAIAFGSSPVIMLLFMINGVFRGAGNAALAMKSLWIANIINIILDPLCIWQFGLAGAAIATTIGRASGVAYQCYHMFKGSGIIKLNAKSFAWDNALMKQLVKIATPGTMQFLIASGSWIFLARLVVQTGGEDATAGYQTAIRLLLFFILPAWGMSNAAATLVGQHLGAKQPVMAEASVLATVRYNAWFMAGVTLFFLLLSPVLLGFFIPEENAKAFGITALRVISLGYIVYGIGMVLANAFNGAGDTRTPTIINLIGFWAIQIPLAYLLSIVWNLGPLGVFIAIPAAEMMNTIMYYYVFKKGRWKNTKV